NSTWSLFAWQRFDNLNGPILMQQGGSFYVYLFDTNGASHDYSIGGGILLNTWRHVAWTYDRTAGQSKFYLDGTLYDTRTVGAFTPRTSFDIYLGKRLDEGIGYRGQLDEVSVYSR